MRPARFRRPAAAAGLAVLAGIGIAGPSIGSDHQDTPEVEISPRMDINDVYAFPGSSDDRIVLVMTTSSPLTPAQSATAAFDDDLLYQFKIDNSGDAVEDLVLQVTFRGDGTDQRVELRGPVRPNETGMLNTLVDARPAVSGEMGETLGSDRGIQLFAGLRDDPFFLDLEQFFRILPDRKPATGTLSQLPDVPTAGAFRSPGVDFFRGINTLAIVVELPEAMLVGSGSGKIGVWGTISR